MNKRFTILALVIAGVIASVLGGGIFDFWDTAIGITLLLILSLYPYEEINSKLELRAVACARALVWVMIIGVGVDTPFFLAAQKWPRYTLFLKSGSPLYLGSLLLLLIWGGLSYKFMRSRLPSKSEQKL